MQFLICVAFALSTVRVHAEGGDEVDFKSCELALLTLSSGRGQPRLFVRRVGTGLRPHDEPAPELNEYVEILHGRLDLNALSLNGVQLHFGPAFASRLEMVLNPDVTLLLGLLDENDVLTLESRGLALAEIRRGREPGVEFVIRAAEDEVLNAVATRAHDAILSAAMDTAGAAYFDMGDLATTADFVTQLTMGRLFNEHRQGQVRPIQLN